MSALTFSRDQLISAQASVIGSVLIDPRCAGEILHRTRESDYTGEYRSIYTAVQALFREGRPIDPITVKEQLCAGQEYNAFLLQLMDITPSTANISTYIDLLRDQSRLAKLQEIGQLLLDSRSLDEANKLMAKASKLMVDRPSVRIVGMQDGLLSFFERQNKKPELIPWGFEVVDRTLHAEPGDLVILGGYPSAGKTAFSLQLAWAQAKDRKVGYFSLETKPEKLIDRAVATVCGVDFGNIKAHEMTEEEWDTVLVKATAMRERKLEIIQAGSMSVMDIQAISLSKGFDIIYVDYLQLITPDDRRRSDFEQVSQISRDLHNMATTTGTTICALSQLSRPKDTGKQEKAPGLHSLRQSGQIEQDADAVMLLYKENPDYPKSRRVLKIAKNKEGEAGGIAYLNFDGAKQRFTISHSAAPSPKPEAPPEEPDYKQVGLTELPDNEPVPF